MDSSLTPQNKGNILIVDDTPENLHLLSDALTEAGYDVRGVVNGKMGLRVARSALPDLILLDIRLPDLSGYEVCQQLKANSSTRDIPVIFLSALDDTIDKIKGFQVGGIDYITKPFQLEEVLARIATHLALQAARKEIYALNVNLEQRVQQRTAQLQTANQQLQAEIAERQKVELALRESEARFRLLAENMSELVCLHQPNGQYLYVSPSCTTLLGFQPEELVGLHPDHLIHPNDVERIRLEEHLFTLQGAPLSTTHRCRRKDGTYIWLETLAKPIVDETGQVVQFQTSSRDVTERVEAQEQLAHDALHDSLTNLPNRALFIEQIEFAVRQAKRRPDYQFAVLFIDLDQFKLVNDSLGHLIGDQLLIAIARLLESCLRPTDIVARLGGDEFTILLDDVQEITDATRVAERIQEKFTAPITLAGHTVFTTASIGIVLGTHDYKGAADLLRDADTAMYRAKEAGRNRYQIFNKAMHLQAMQRLHLENDLRRALEHQEFMVYYQPIIALETQRLMGFEALVRWQHPEQGLVYPGEFISVAEDTGLILPIGKSVLQQACQQLKSWQQQFPSASQLTMSVNLSSQQLKQADFIQQLDEVLGITQLDGQYLKLEITESMLIENLEAVARLLYRIKHRNIRLSIDDFGTGYSSLSYLHRLPINTLKIDRSFVNQMTTEAESQGIVRAIVSLAHTLGMDVIAEGIETPEQFTQLQKLQCELGQGYFFFQPLDSLQAIELLQNR